MIFVHPVIVIMELLLRVAFHIYINYIYMYNIIVILLLAKSLGYIV